MPAAATDKFIKGARRWSGQIGASGVSDASVTTISLVSTTGLPTDTAVELTIDRVDASGNLTTSKEEIIRGVVSGTNIISAVRGVEGTAQAHSAGAVVEVRLTASMWNRLVDGLLTFATQTGKIVLSAMDGSRYATDAGGDDTYSVTLDPVPAAYYAGMEVNFKPTTANTGACTLDVNGLGAKTIKKNVSSDLATGDILAGQMVKVIYDGTNFQLVSLKPEQTFIAPRTDTVASSATPSINTDTTDIFTVTALATAITSMTTNLTGAPVNGQKLTVRIKDDGTARAITWGASFVARGASLPATTVISKYLYVGLIYNSTESVWDCVAVSLES